MNLHSNMSALYKWGRSIGMWDVGDDPWKYVGLRWEMTPPPQTHTHTHIHADHANWGGVFKPYKPRYVWWQHANWGFTHIWSYAANWGHTQHMNLNSELRIHMFDVNIQIEYLFTKSLFSHIWHNHAKSKVVSYDQ